MADKSSDIQHLFEHLGLDPQDYREVRAKKEEQGEHVDRWSLLTEISGNAQKTADIPEDKRRAASDLGASKRAARIAQIQTDAGRDAEGARNAATVAAAQTQVSESAGPSAPQHPPEDTDVASPAAETTAQPKLEVRSKAKNPDPVAKAAAADTKPESEPEQRGLGKNLRSILGQAKLLRGRRQDGPAETATERRKAPEIDENLARPVEKLDRNAEPDPAASEPAETMGPTPETTPPITRSKDLPPLRSQPDAGQSKPAGERPSEGRDEFEDAIEEVARAAKAEVRRRMEEEKQRQSEKQRKAEALAAQQQAEREAELQRQQLAAEQAEANRLAREEQAREEQARELQAKEQQALEAQQRAEQQRQAALAAQREAQAAAERKRTAERAAAAERQRLRDEALAAEAELAREQQAQEAERQRQSTVRNLRPDVRPEAPRRTEQKPRLRPEHIAAVRQREHRQQAPLDVREALIQTFKRLKQPEKPAIRSDGKLRLGYGVRSGVKAEVLEQREQTVKQVFERLKQQREGDDDRD